MCQVREEVRMMEKVGSETKSGRSFDQEGGSLAGANFPQGCSSGPASCLGDWATGVEIEV